VGFCGRKKMFGPCDICKAYFAVYEDTSTYPITLTAPEIVMGPDDGVMLEVQQICGCCWDWYIAVHSSEGCPCWACSEWKNYQRDHLHRSLQQKGAGKGGGPAVLARPLLPADPWAGMIADASPPADAEPPTAAAVQLAPPGIEQLPVKAGPFDPTGPAPPLKAPPAKASQQTPATGQTAAVVQVGNEVMERLNDLETWLGSQLTRIEAKLNRLAGPTPPTSLRDGGGLSSSADSANASSGNAPGSGGAGGSGGGGGGAGASSGSGGGGAGASASDGTGGFAILPDSAAYTG
jgi:hypothetical protein